MSGSQSRACFWAWETCGLIPRRLLGLQGSPHPGPGPDPPWPKGAVACRSLSGAQAAGTHGLSKCSRHAGDQVRAQDGWQCPGWEGHAAVLATCASAFYRRCMSRTSVTPSPLPAPDPVPLESEAAAEEGAVGCPEPSPGTAQPLRRDLGKVPKWLKLPGTKGDWAGRAAGPELGLRSCMWHCSQQEVRAASWRCPLGRGQDPPPHPECE